jgi:hypothetical protein
VSKSKGRKPNKSKRKPSKSVNPRKSTKKVTRRRKEETTEEEVSDLEHDGVSSVEDYETDSEEEAPRQSFGMLVGQNLPQKQREKIKQGKFVEMSDLLPQNYTKKGSVVFKMSATKGMQALKQSTNTFVTLEQWNEAFAVYMSVRVETSKSKQEAVTMMKEMITYQRDINSLSKQNLQWHVYDRMFRRDYSEQASPVSFGTIRHDLMLHITMLSANRAPTNRLNNFRPKRIQTRFQGGYRDRSTDNRRSENICFSYNAMDKTCQFGNNCRFRHVCTSCRGQHQQFNCKNKSGVATPNTASTAGIGRGQPPATSGRQGHPANGAQRTTN